MIIMKIYFLLVMMTFLLTTSCDPGDEKIVHYTSENTLAMGLPFSDAILYDDMIFLSGQIGNLPGEMKLVEGGIKAEANQTMTNIKSVLEANGAQMDDIIKCTVMIADIGEWGAFNEEYVKFFPNHKPARSAFGANGLALGARVEVECIARRP